MTEEQAVQPPRGSYLSVAVTLFIVTAISLSVCNVLSNFIVYVCIMCVFSASSDSDYRVKGCSPGLYLVVGEQGSDNIQRRQQPRP